jgi:hypothetical protein
MFHIQDDNVYFNGHLVMRREPGTWPTLWGQVEKILLEFGTDESDDYNRGMMTRFPPETARSLSPQKRRR